MEHANFLDEDGDVDIFRYLDVSLLEIFQRQQLLELFGEHSPEEAANYDWERINAVVANVLSRQRERTRRRELKLKTSWEYFTIWHLWLLPLPIFHLSQWWHDCYPMQHVRAILANLRRFSFTIGRYLRITIEMILLSIYFHNIFEHLSVFANLVTFSDSFTRDILTYAFRNSEDMLRRHTELFVHKGNIFYFADGNNVGTLEFVRSTVYNWFARSLMTTCLGDGEVNACYLHSTSLVFKFDSVLATVFPQLATRSWLLTTATLAVYNFYALGGWLVGLNVFLFLSFNLAKRLMRFGSVCSGLGEIVRTTLGEIL